MSYCAGCNGKIHDRFIMKVLDKDWHTSCLICCECGQSLAEKCFTKDGKFYCKNDFYKEGTEARATTLHEYDVLQHGTQCTKCKLPITYTDLIRRTGGGGVFHVHCFTCSVCSRQLDTGEEFYTLPDNTFFCKNDFNYTPPLKPTPENEVHSTTGDAPSARSLSPHQLSPASQLSPAVVSTTVHESPNSDSNIKQESSPEDIIFKKDSTSDNEQIKTNSPDTSSSQVSTTTGKRRGPRTTIKSKQLEILKDAFNKTPKPTRHIREQLATKTGLNMRVIQVWFQNRRSKERRMKQMNLVSRGRYGAHLSRDHHEDYGYVQDHFFRGGECYYGSDLRHPVEQGFMQCLQVPGMDTSTRGLEHGPWPRGQYETPPLTAPDMLNIGYSTPVVPSWGSMVPDSTNQIAFQT